MLRVLARNREFRALAISNTLSLAGDDLARVALAIVFYQQTRSAFIAAFTFGLSFIPSLVAGPLLSTLGDRFPRRHVMVVCDVARTVLVGLGAVALGVGWPTAVPLGLLLLAAFFSPAFEASRGALMPHIVADDEYVGASVATGIAAQMSQIVTYVLGAAAVASIGGDGALVIDAATFGLSAVVLVLYVRPGTPRSAETSERGAGVFRMMMTGAKDVLSRPALRSLLLLAAVTLAACAVPEALAVVYAAQHGVTGTGQGLLVAAIPIGTALGGLAITRLVPARRQSELIRPLALGTCLPLIATALPVGPVVVFVLWVLVGAMLSFQFLANAAFVLATPDYVRARAMGLAQSLLTLAQTVGMLVGGGIATAVDARYVVAGAGALALAGVTVIVLRWPAALGSASADGPAAAVPTPMPSGGQG